MNKVILISELYKNAREHLGLSQRQVAKDLDVSGVQISKIETGKTQSPNHFYTTYLIEKGINPYYLIGASDIIEGQLVDVVSSSKYKSLESENETLKSELDKLENQVSDMVSRSDFERLLNKVKEYESVFKMLKIEVPEGSDVRKKGDASNFKTSRKVKTHRELGVATQVVA